VLWLGVIRFALTPIPASLQNLLEKGVKKMSPFFIPFAITNMGGALFGIETGFMGPNYSISTACATANYCFNRCQLPPPQVSVRVARGFEALRVLLTGLVARGTTPSQRGAAPDSWRRRHDRGGRV
jgi:3-oxoacyl-[acyl-carrier-protein] synthase II